MNRMFSLAAGFAAALSLMAGPAITAHAADYNGPKIKFRVAHTTPRAITSPWLLKSSRNWWSRRAAARSKSRSSPTPFWAATAC